jgi:hypothetical protein
VVILARQEICRQCNTRWDEEPCGPAHRLVDRMISFSGEATRVRISQARVREGKNPLRGVTL